MYCKFCGKKIPNKSKFCQYCGINLSQYKKTYKSLTTKEKRKISKLQHSNFNPSLSLLAKPQVLTKVEKTFIFSSFKKYFLIILGLGFLFFFLIRENHLINKKNTPNISIENALNEKGGINNPQNCDINKTISKVEKCTVLILTEKKSGSGFLYQNGFIITNKHVIASAKTIQVFDYFKNKYPATIQNYSETIDLAVLKTDINQEGCEIVLDKPIKGEEIAVLGYPGNSGIPQIDYSEAALSKGRISRFAEYKDSYLVEIDVEIDATVNPGNSGGPLINKCGIIGIVTAKATSPNVESVGYAISSVTVNKILPALLASKKNVQTVPDYNYFHPDKYYEQPPYNYYEQYNIDEEKIKLAINIRNFVNNLRNIWKNSDVSMFDKNTVDEIKDILERMANVTENILPKVINQQSISNEEKRLISELSGMNYKLNQLQKNLDLYFDGNNYYYYKCINNSCSKVTGLGKNQCKSFYDCQPKYRYACKDMACVKIEGEGKDDCYFSSDCYHYVCDNGQCKKIPGKGTNECYSDYSCKHNECREGKCIEIIGPGTNQCYSDYSCRHKECQNGKCVEINTPGTNTCYSDYSCR